jgi:hypothetical protein
VGIQLKQKNRRQILDSLDKIREASFTNKLYDTFVAVAVVTIASIATIRSTIQMDNLRLA